MKLSKKHTIVVTGGAGYVGSVLVPKLLAQGYDVRVLDWYLYGTESSLFGAWATHDRLTHIKGDIRDADTVKKAVNGADVIIHLACISNDPSYELNPDLGKSINYDATLQLIRYSEESRVKQFIYASSSSVYGVKSDPDVTEDLSLEPLTDYSRYKALCEPYVLEMSHAIPTVLRPATVCGYAPRLRLDLTVNMLTVQALVNKKITVFGGDQKRPNIHIDDMTDAYVSMLTYPKEKISKEIFNVGYDNMRVGDIASLVKHVIGDDGIQIITTPTDDHRSYHVSSEKIYRFLGFRAKRGVEDAIRDIVLAYESGEIQDPLMEKRYYNIRMMQSSHIS